ncbi:MAG: transketolase [Candidatus Nanoarchaeia archaeon]|nr:transketolase [Candidatus Nanoarchaeia archaeon]
MSKNLEELSKEEIKKISSNIRCDIIEMTTLANSGHLGGPLGFVEPALVAYLLSDIDWDDPFSLDNDIIIHSAGHYSALFYSIIAELNKNIDKDEMIFGFRKINSPFEGHVNHKIPGIWWTSGVLGYGPAVANGFRIALDKLNHNNKITVTLGDGEITKGSIPEALRFSEKYSDNLTHIIDRNHRQINGQTNDVMPINIEKNYRAQGWEVIRVDGYDIDEISKSIKEAEGLTAIIAETTMGKGVKLIEGNSKYHGTPLSREEAEKAIEIIGKDIGRKPRFESLERKKLNESKVYISRPKLNHKISQGSPTNHTNPISCREAWGKTLENLAEINKNIPFIVFDCDLSSSVQTSEFAKKYPENFFQAGIQENSTALTAGASSIFLPTFFADFGIFSVDEVYQQHRLTALNEGNLKLISTHCGLDVGQDGPTHQCIDYLMLEGIPNWQTFVASDANLTDRIVRYMASNYGNMHLAIGRSKVPIIKKQDKDEPFYNENYEFRPGKVNTIRDYGEQAVIYTYGSMTHRAVKAAEELNKIGINIKVLDLTTPLSPDKGSVKDAITEQTKIIVTYEDHFIGKGNQEGISPVIKSILYNSKFRPEIYALGIKNFSKSGTPDELYKDSGIHENDLMDLIKEKFKIT